MELTKKNIIKLEKMETNKLKKYVYSYILDAFNEYIDKTAIFNDVLRHW